MYLKDRYPDIPQQTSDVLRRLRYVPEYGTPLSDLIAGAKTWKWAPGLPLRMAVSVAALSLKMRVLAGLYWCIHRDPDNFWDEVQVLSETDSDTLIRMAVNTPGVMNTWGRLRLNTLVKVLTDVDLPDHVSTNATHILEYVHEKQAASSLREGVD